MQPAGWPDRLVVSCEWIGLLEFKGVKTAVRPLQRVIIRELRKRGPYAFIAREPGELWDDEVLLGRFTTGRELLKMLHDRVSTQL